MHRIDGAGHVNNQWVAEDPDTLRPPTEITPDIMNALQEELVSIVLWAEKQLDKGNNSQVLEVLLEKFAQLASPVFTGEPKAPTAAPNNISKQLANTEFVQNLVASINIGAYAKLAAAQVFTKGQAGLPKPLPATAGSVPLDLAEGNNWEGVLTGNIVLANPDHITPGQSGVIRIINGATPYTIAYGSYWKATSGVFPTLTPVAGAVDLLGYYVEAPNRIWIGAQGDSK